MFPCFSRENHDAVIYKNQNIHCYLTENWRQSLLNGIDVPVHIRRVQWILSASFWSHRWSNWANIGAVVYLAAKRTISVAISTRIRTKVTWPLAGSIALLSSSFEVHKNEFHFLSTRAALRFLRNRLWSCSSGGATWWISGEVICY